MTALEWIVSVHALLAAGFTAVALVRVRRPARRRQGGPAKVLLLRPVDAPTAQELANLAAAIDHPDVEHVVVSPFRPRLPANVRWLPSDPTTANRKVGHVLYALDTLGVHGRSVVVADADVRVHGALIEALVEPLARGVALTTAAPSPVCARELDGGFVLESLLGHTHHSFLALDAMSWGAKAICGKAMGLSGRALSELRGLGAHVGEDLELAARLHARGEPVELAAELAPLPQQDTALGAVMDRLTRWMQVLRAHRPALHPTVPLFFAPTPLLLPAAIALGASWPAACVLLLLLVRAAFSVRLAVLRRAGFGGAAWRWLVAETVLLVAFARSLGRRHVEWRGRRYQLHPGGHITVAPERERRVRLA